MIPSVKVTTHAGIAGSDVCSEEFSRRRIYLTGEINQAMSADICAQINHLAAQSRDDIILVIQSPGGSVTAGNAILDTMHTCGCDVATVVMGEAASMGAVIASSGTKGKRYIGESAEMMLHQALGGASGQAADILKAADHIRQINNKLHMLIARNTGKTIEQIVADCDRDFYLDSEDSISYGLADKLFTGFDDIE